MNSKIVFAGAVRTAIGKFGGALAGIPAALIAAGEAEIVVAGGMGVSAIVKRNKT
jgi:acetyl-CoA acetyltransferase